jgi:hypothetical protein
MIRVPDDAVGKQVRCPKCDATTMVPAEGSPPDPTAVTATPLPPTSGADPEAFSTAPTRPHNLTDEPDDFEPSRRSRYDDGDDDLLDVRARRPKSQTNGMAMAAMILGIVSVVAIPGSCACSGFSAVAIMCAILAIIFGILGKTPGSENYAWTGIICGSVSLALVAVGIVLLVGFCGLNLAFNR